MHTIERAAVLAQDGTVHSVPEPGRHHDVIRAMAAQGAPIPRTANQGFVTSAGRFVRRGEAARIAFAAGQTGTNTELLLSEDLW